MPDEKYVPLDAFVATIKIQFSLINDLTVSVMTLRAALMQAKEVPVPAEELKRLHEFFQDYAPIREAREVIERLGSVSTSEALDQFLKDYKGPIQ
jgi:hypothetical protein